MRRSVPVENITEFLFYIEVSCARGPGAAFQTPPHEPRPRPVTNAASHTFRAPHPNPPRPCIPAACLQLQPRVRCFCLPSHHRARPTIRGRKARLARRRRSLRPRSSCPPPAPAPRRAQPREYSPPMSRLCTGMRGESRRCPLCSMPVCCWVQTAHSGPETVFSTTKRR